MAISELAQDILQAAVSKQVAERLGSITRELGEFTKNMTTVDAKNAKLMLLSMIESGCVEFHQKMKRRIENRRDDSE